MITIESLTRLSPQDHVDLGLLLRDATENGASVGYILPIAEDDIGRYWQGVAAEVIAGNCTLLVARQGDQMVGTGQLALATKPNARHRAEVQKVLVHSRARQQGVARQLMLAIEQHARAAGRSLLVLDTETNSAGQLLYAAMGYEVAGEIPKYAMATSIGNPGDASGGWSPSTFMYKILQAP